MALRKTLLVSLDDLLALALGLNQWRLQWLAAGVPEPGCLALGSGPCLRRHGVGDLRDLQAKAAPVPASNLDVTRALSEACRQSPAHHSASVATCRALISAMTVEALRTNGTRHWRAGEMTALFPAVSVTDKGLPLPSQTRCSPPPGLPMARVSALFS